MARIGLGGLIGVFLLQICSIEDEGCDMLRRARLPLWLASHVSVQQGKG